MIRTRKKSIAFGGGAFGDEGKGRIVDKYVNDFAKTGKVIVYRDNGGAGSGHTVELDNGQRVAFHQLPSGLFVKNAIVVLGKGMVLHPGDIVEEISVIKKVLNGKLIAQILIDEMATLSLDTHRAFEATLKSWQDGSKGSTGRGIGPAYADIVLRHPLRIRDLVPFNAEKVAKHYRLYAGLVKGLGATLADVEVPWLKNNEKGKVGTEAEFIARLKKHAAALKPHVSNVYQLIEKAWKDPKYAFVFEKAQGLGLDARWGVYPDVSGSDMTFDGILASTEGSVDPDEIETRAVVLKATYMSSVGARKLPTVFTDKLAERIREDAKEYGATTKRPRDIAYFDVPASRFFLKMGRANSVVLTHMDVAYKNVPVKVCVGYTQKGKPANYRPDQEYLLTVKPVYREFASWDVAELRKARSFKDLPKNAKLYLKFLEKALGLPIMMITTGPKREQGIIF